MKTTAVGQPTPPLAKGGAKQTTDQGAAARTTFVGAALNMSWQLALAVLVPVIGGVQLDKALNTDYVCTFIGLGVALIGSIVVMWRTVQAANRLPVPKLTDAQRRAIRQSYEAEDDD